MSPIEVRRTSDARTVARVLTAAFRNDPVTRWLLPDGPRTERLFQAMARHLHGEAHLAVRDGVPVGAALWDPPGHRVSRVDALLAAPSFALVMRRRLPRWRALETVMSDYRPPGPVLYLAELGATTPGHGAGTTLLEQRLATTTTAAYLESSNRRNISLYERFGFEVTEEVRLPFDGPAMWLMLRPEPSNPVE